MAWSAGVSAAAAGLAALFAARQTVLDHILFRSLAVVGLAAFAVLLGTAIHRPTRSRARTFLDAVRAVAVPRAGQVRSIDQMPVRWEVTPAAHEAMASGLRSNDGIVTQLQQFAGEFRDFGSAFERMSPRRIVILGGAGAGKTTLVSKLFDDLLRAAGGLGVPVSVPAAHWGGGGDICGWVAAQFKATRNRVCDALRNGEILLAIEDFEGLPPVLRAKAIDRINELEPDQPLLITSRPNEYLNTVKEHLKPIRNAVVVELLPLTISDVGEYLKANTPTRFADRWKTMSDFLKSIEGLQLATVLTNPLMLWLTREIYSAKETHPGELADTGRFGSQEAIEGHLLDELVPRKFAFDDARRAGTSRWTGPQAQRWLAFLAADLDNARARDITWWRLVLAAPGGWLVTFALRAALLTAAAWYAASWALRRGCRGA